jgi:hypothetical protein
MMPWAKLGRENRCQAAITLVPSGSDSDIYWQDILDHLGFALCLRARKGAYNRSNFPVWFRLRRGRDYDSDSPGLCTTVRYPARMRQTSVNAGDDPGSPVRMAAHSNAALAGSN